jgi:xanthine dehydrogenase YagS FAD-binding subunit
MKTFEHFNAKTIEEAVSILERYRGKAKVIAGGTDLLGKMKDRILPTYPEALVNIKTISGLNEIEEKAGLLRVGALTVLEDIAHHSAIKDKYTALAEAARRTASPHLREMGTIGGNISQDIRCWYYRNPGNRFPCLRKGGGRCYAWEGDKRYHSIFGGSVPEGCLAVHPSDLAPALVVLGAYVQTSKRRIKIEDFFQIEVTKTTVLGDSEIITEIQIPELLKNSRSAFLKFAFRKSIDFPIVNCAAYLNQNGGRIAEARVCLNAVHVKPYRAVSAEQFLIGKEISKEVAVGAGEAAIEGAQPLGDNDFMVPVAKTLVARTVLGCFG